MDGNLDPISPEVVNEAEINEPIVDPLVDEQIKEIVDEETIVKQPQGGQRRPNDKDLAVMLQTEGNPNPQKIRTDEVTLGKMLRANGGYQSVVARKLGISVQAVSARIKRSKYLQGVMKDVSKSVEDLAVNELLKAIKRGEAWAITFWLKCRAGWVENDPRVNMEDGDEQRVITFNVIPQSVVNAAKEQRDEMTKGDGQ